MGEGLLARAGRGQRFCFSSEEAPPPCSDSLSGVVRCHLEAFSFSLHYPVLPWEFGGEREQKRERSVSSGEGSSNEIIVRKFCGTLELQPQALLPGLRAPLINSQSVFCPIGFSGADFCS